MSESRWINTGAGAYTGRRTGTRNANRHHYGDAATDSPVGARVFAPAHRHLDAVGAAGAAGAGPLRAAVARIEAEVARGDAADGPAVARALRTIADLVPDLAATIAAGLIAPSAGVAMVVRSAAGQAIDRRG